MRLTSSSTGRASNSWAKRSSLARMGVRLRGRDECRAPHYAVRSGLRGCDGGLCARREEVRLAGRARPQHKFAYHKGAGWASLAGRWTHPLLAHLLRGSVATELVKYEPPHRTA